MFVRVMVEMLVLVTAAPLIAYMIGRGGWGRAGVIGHPLVGLAAFNVTLVALLAPPVVQVMGRSPALSAVAELGFLLAAILFWWPILRPQAAGGLAPISKIGYLLIAGVPPTIPGTLLAFSRHLLYPGLQSAGAFGLTPLQDQQLGGLLLFGTAKAILVTLTLVTLWRLLGGEPDASDDGWHEPGVPVEPVSPPAWFQRLHEELPSEPARPLPVPVASAPRTVGN
jgi:cytochrome c oxidase assembly factor CtaG